MNEIIRIARLLEQTFEGKPYYGPSVLDALSGVTAAVAMRRPPWSVHNIWELVTHLTAELQYVCTVVDGNPKRWIDGETTWPAITDISEVAWQRAVTELKKANRAFVRKVKQLDDAILDKKPVHVRGPST